MSELSTRVRRHPPTMLLAAAVVAALAVAGCGGSSDKSSSSSSSSKAKSSQPATSTAGLTETESEFKFSKPSPTVKAKGGKVTVALKNGGKTTHALEIEGPKGEVKSKLLSPGQSATVTAKLKPGKYEFYCPVDGHKKLGMKGELTVQ